MNRLLAAIPFVFPVFVAAQDSVGPVKDDPPRITPEMKAKTETIARALEGLTPEGFTKKSLVERYTEANLYEKIDGRSELFHSYDVTGMTFVTFSKADDPSKFIDVFLYDMTTPLGAFGVYSVERPSGSKAIATGDGGHRTGADLFFRKGQYYASILTSGPDEEVQKAASALADTLANRLKGEAAELWGLAMLPAKNRIDDTVQYPALLEASFCTRLTGFEDLRGGDVFDLGPALLSWASASSGRAGACAASAARPTAPAAPSTPANSTGVRSWNTTHSSSGIAIIIPRCVIWISSAT